MRWPRKPGSSPARCGCATWSGRRKCRSTTSPRSISTAAIIRKPCGAPSRRSTSPRCASVSARNEPDGRLIGVGLSVYCEQAAHGTSVYAGWGIPMVPGHEQATARMTPDGGLEIRVGVHSHGQGLETTLAQVAHEILGIDTAKVRVIHGDTAHDALLDRHLGLALDGDGRRRGRDGLRRDRRARETHRRQTAAARSGFGIAARRPRLRAEQQHRPFRDRAYLVPAAAGSAARCRPGGPGNRPAATSRSATAAPSAMPCMPSPLPSIPISAMSSCSITSSSRTAACWSIR